MDRAYIQVSLVFVGSESNLVANRGCVVRYLGRGRIQPCPGRSVAQSFKKGSAPRNVEEREELYLLLGQRGQLAIDL